MKLRHKKFQDGGLPKGEKLKIKKYKCKQGEICEFTVKTKNHTHSKQRHFTMLGGGGGGEGKRYKNITNVDVMYELYVKKTFKTVPARPWLARLCISNIWYPDCSSMYLHTTMFSHTDYLLKCIVNYEDFEPNVFQQHHKIEYHCFV